MITGVIFRLVVSLAFFAIAYFALRPDTFASILRSISQTITGTDDAYDGAQEFQQALAKGFYCLSALFFLFASTFLYHHMRTLRVKTAPISGARPYGGGSAPAPGNRPAPTRAPEGSQPYGGSSGGSQPSGVQPGSGGSQPYGGGSGGSSQPSGVQPGSGGSRPYGGQ